MVYHEATTVRTTLSTWKNKTVMFKAIALFFYNLSKIKLENRSAVFVEKIINSSYAF